MIRRSRASAALGLSFAVQLLAGALPALADPLADMIANCHKNDDAAFDKSRINVSLESKLYKLFVCRDDLPAGASMQNDHVACNWFVGQALNDIWHRHEFFLAPAGRYMLTSEIAAIPDDKWDGLGWRLLGMASDQAALTKAEQNAASGKAVIAVKTGHVALLLPGGLIKSGWGPNVPRAAQLSIDHIDYAFVGCKLSLSFQKADSNSVKVLSTK